MDAPTPQHPRKPPTAPLQPPRPRPQEKLLARALPKPFRFTDILRNAEGVAASSTHPGDHRYLNFDYE